MNWRSAASLLRATTTAFRGRWPAYLLAGGGALLPALMAQRVLHGQLKESFAASPGGWGAIVTAPEHVTPALAVGVILGAFLVSGLAAPLAMAMLARVMVRESSAARESGAARDGVGMIVLAGTVGLAYLPQLAVDLLWHLDAWFGGAGVPSSAGFVSGRSLVSFVAMAVASFVVTVLRLFVPAVVAVEGRVGVDAIQRAIGLASASWRTTVPFVVCLAVVWRFSASLVRTALGLLFFWLMPLPFAPEAVFLAAQLTGTTFAALGRAVLYFAACAAPEANATSEQEAAPALA